MTFIDFLRILRRSLFGVMVLDGVAEDLRASGKDPRVSESGLSYADVGQFGLFRANVFPMSGYPGLVTVSILPMRENGTSHYGPGYLLPQPFEPGENFAERLKRWAGLDGVG